MKKRKKEITRPDDNLPLPKLKKQWEEYLKTQIVAPTSTRARSRFEILMTPEQLEFYAEKVPQDWMKMPLSPRLKLFVEALHRCIPKLPLIQQLVVKKYYGLSGKEAKTESEIMQEIGLPHLMSVSRHIARAKRRLNSLIRSELRRLVRERLRRPQGRLIRLNTGVKKYGK